PPAPPRPAQHRRPAHPAGRCASPPSYKLRRSRRHQGRGRMASPQPADAPLPLSHVLREEYAALRPEWREELAAAVSVPDEADEAARLARLFAVVHGRSQREGGAVDGRAQRPLAALCFSGGGIRSAT